ncbi:hypothetical protein A2U01_0090226, partial [Trifolium medium]|nr:hypothetical protein [Trifolium medium]
GRGINPFVPSGGNIQGGGNPLINVGNIQGGRNEFFFSSGGSGRPSAGRENAGRASIGMASVRRTKRGRGRGGNA